MRFVAIRTLMRRIRHIKDYLRDPSASKIRKLLIIFGIIYLLSPIDLIPAPVLGFSVIDDAVLWTAILTWLAGELDRYGEEGGAVSEAARRKYDSADIIDAEARVIDEEEETDAGGTE